VALKSFILLFAISTTPAYAQRTYWPVSLDSLSIGRARHTHVEVRGVVAPNYPKTESDGDRHIKLLSPSGRYVIVECIPLLPTPCVGVKTGQTLVVRGITRLDPEHGWWEVHPAESITLVK
jgi:hypothetical protein